MLRLNYRWQAVAPLLHHHRPNRRRTLNQNDIGQHTLAFIIPICRWESNKFRFAQTNSCEYYWFICDRQRDVRFPQKVFSPLVSHLLCVTITSCIHHPMRRANCVCVSVGLCVFIRIVHSINCDANQVVSVGRTIFIIIKLTFFFSLGPLILTSFGRFMHSHVSHAFFSFSLSVSICIDDEWIEFNWVRSQWDNNGE